MTQRTLQMLVLAMACALAIWHAAAQSADPTKDVSKRELERLEGVWTIISKEVRGQKSPGEEVKQMQLTIKGNRWVMTHANGSDKATIRIDPTKNPKTIDLTWSSLGAMGSSLTVPGGRKIVSRGI